MGAVGGVDADPFGLVGLNRQESAELGAVRCLTTPWVVAYPYISGQGARTGETKMTTATAAVETATLTFDNCTATYTPIFGTGRMFVCTCGMETDSGFDFWTTHRR